MWIFTAVCAAVFVGSTALFLLAEPPNPWPVVLSVPVLAFVCAYSWTKRFTALAHFWLGASLLLAPMAAWIAIRGLRDLSAPAVLGLAVLAWVAGFDIIYSCQDADFDRRCTPPHSLPAALRHLARRCASPSVATSSSLGLLLALYFCASPPLGVIYLAGLGLVAILILYEHAPWSRHTTHPRQSGGFFQVNAIISVGLLVVLLVEIARIQMVGDNQIERRCFCRGRSRAFTILLTTISREGS